MSTPLPAVVASAALRRRFGGWKDSCQSYRLAQHFGIGITEVDDFQVLLERMTTPEQQPALHFWRTHPAPDNCRRSRLWSKG